MRRLVWAFAFRTYRIVVNLMSRLIFQNKLKADPESAFMRILLIHPPQINILDFCLA